MGYNALICRCENVDDLNVDDLNVDQGNLSSWLRGICNMDITAIGYAKEHLIKMSYKILMF